MKTVEQGKLTFYYDVVQGTQEWLELRENKVTCSNALMLMNKGKNACMEANRLASIRITPNGNFYAERGHVIEHDLKQAYNDELKDDGLVLEECGFIMNEDFPDAGYSPDGLICPLMLDGTGDVKHIQALAEFKAYNDIVIRNEHTPQEEKVLTGKHRLACQDILKVPPQAIAQCNMAMLLTESDLVYLFLCNPDARETDLMIKSLREEVKKLGEKLLSPAGLTLEETARLKDIKNQLKTAVPNEDYDTPTPITKVWMIRRNETICSRLKEKLSR